jgi:K+-sensing histidine kinase KdpD
VHKERIFETDLQPGLPEVYADYNQIKQVLINLLENAVAYSEAGTKIAINARVVDGMVEVGVSDQGVGIALDDLGGIFEKFYCGSHRQQRPRGVGLGLAICRPSSWPTTGGYGSRVNRGTVPPFILDCLWPHRTITKA